jgi:hypothetical protein
METRPETDRGANYDASTASTPPEKASIVEDFIDIFHAPSRVFARRAHTGYGIPLLAVSLLAAVFGFVNRGIISQIMDAEFARNSAKMLADNPRLTQEMLDKGKGFQAAIGMVVGYLGTPIFILIAAIFVWLFAKVVSAKISYAQAATITTFAWIPRLLGSLIMTVQVLLMDTSNVTNFWTLSASPARFMDRDATNPKLYALLGSLDIFAIWFTVLVGIGIATMGKVPRNKGYIAAALFFVLGLLPTVLFAK